MILEKLKLNGELVVITGGAGLLGLKHAESVAEIGGVPILLDIDEIKLKEAEKHLRDTYNCKVKTFRVDITDEKEIIGVLGQIKSEFKKSPYGLINNAAINPKANSKENLLNKRFESFPLEDWNLELNVGLTGAFICSKIFGKEMADVGKGVIINVASDLGVIAPDQRIYQEEGIEESKQKVKPVTYSVIKHGIIGLTKYLATYWAHKNIRVNSISMGGVSTGNEPKEFLKKLTNLIPMGRMANKDEYKAAIAFLLTDASSYMTGSNLIMDGGRTCW